MNIASDVYLRLSAQRALLTHVTPPLRSVSVDLDVSKAVVFTRFIFEREPSDSERDTAFCAAGEIIADYRTPRTIIEEFVVSPPPERMDQWRLVVYMRCEDEWVSPTS